MKLKKFVIAAAFLAGFAAFCQAEFRDVPIGPDGALQSADYGGFQISTYGVVNSNQLVYIPGPCVIGGAIFSSGTAQGLVTVNQITQSTMTSLYTSSSTATEAFRLYHDTSTNNNQGYSGTIQMLKYPAYFPVGATYQANTTAFNSIQVLFQRLSRP